MNSQREAFEKVFPVPGYVRFKDEKNDYDFAAGHRPDSSDWDALGDYCMRWETWQAATEQGVGEAVGIIKHRTNPMSDNPDAYVDWLFGGDVHNLPHGTELYLQPPKPTGGGVKCRGLIAIEGQKAELFYNSDQIKDLPDGYHDIYTQLALPEKKIDSDEECPYCGPDAEYPECPHKGYVDQYQEGWNDCRAAILTTQQPPEQE